MPEPLQPTSNPPRQAAASAAPGTDDYAYGHPIDAIVLAGTHQNPKRLIRGSNKGLLEIAGAPLVRHVARALSAARQVDRIYVVGPAEELRPALAGLGRVVCVPQEGKMVANSWAGVRAAERPYHALPEEQRNARPLLFISCDLPLIVPGAIDDFIWRSAATDQQDGRENALVVGAAEEAGLAPFYGDGDEPGIERPLVQLHEGRMRLANIYVGRPRRLAHTEFLQTSFNLRKAKDWRNV
ncbi:MAG: nucleotidyltransferase family protein, partial [Gammaproteobacteria bacterium]